MVDLWVIAWPVAHVVGGGGWHAADLITALLVVIAVVGLMLIASGRRTRARTARDRQTRRVGGRR